MGTSRSKVSQASKLPPKAPRSPRVEPAAAPQVQTQPGPESRRPDQPGEATVAAARGDTSSQESAARQLFQVIQRLIQAPSPDAASTPTGLMTELSSRAIELAKAERLALEQATGPSAGADQYILVELLSIKVGPQNPAPADTDAGNEPIPPETRTALQLANDLLATPGAWLRTPNPQLGDRRPIDLIDTPEEFKVFNMLNAFQHGLY